MTTLARQRWRMLGEVLLSKNLDLSSEHEDISVMRFKTYGLYVRSLLSSHDQDDGTWCQIEFPSIEDNHSNILSLDIRLCSSKIDYADLMGFNNTGNTCIWPSEEVLAFYCLKEKQIFENKSVCELGGGMTCLAGLALARSISLNELVATDGNEKSIANLNAILKAKSNENNWLCPIESQVLIWSRQLNDPKLKERFDFIISADCFFFEDLHHDLCHTIYYMLKDSAQQINKSYSSDLHYPILVILRKLPAKMKLSRHKFIRRILNYYRTHFNIEYPFIILIDGTFAFEALQWKIQIDEQLKAYLETDQIICSTTLCAIRETELLGGVAFGAMLILKQYEIVKCDHYPSISAEKCFQQVLIKDNTKKYFLASQSLSLREYSHDRRPDLPTMLITHNAINLERPSLNTRSIVEQTKKERLGVSKHDSNILKKIKHELNLDENEDNVTKKKKKKHGINPLSVKKKTKKKSINNNNNNTVVKKKRRRTRQIRMSSHLKEHLKELQKTFSIKEFFHEKKI
ncbi:unnamed protein product [Adineta steineri]|uniref:Calmodulin-lysine N-methyltransferase n=2 Tax=Adineta steineri TaxID=433720 RepID=A0A818ZGS7_9BILA|nr:unnamed protein product [Adineta steineri]